MSRQCELSGELGAAVVKQNTAVLVTTLAYENNIGTFCLHLNETIQYVKKQGSNLQMKAKRAEHKT